MSVETATTTTGKTTWTQTEQPVRLLASDGGVYNLRENSGGVSLVGGPAEKHKSMFVEQKDGMQSLSQKAASGENSSDISKEQEGLLAVASSSIASTSTSSPRNIQLEQQQLRIQPPPISTSISGPVHTYHQRTDSASSTEEAIEQGKGKGKGKRVERGESAGSGSKSGAAAATRSDGIGDLEEADAALLMTPIISRTQSGAVGYFDIRGHNRFSPKERVTDVSDYEENNGFTEQQPAATVTTPLPAGRSDTTKEKYQQQQQKTGVLSSTAQKLSNISSGLGLASSSKSTSGGAGRQSPPDGDLNGATAPRQAGKRNSLFPFTIPTFHLPQMPSAPSFLSAKASQLTGTRKRSMTGMKSANNTPGQSPRTSMFFNSKPWFPEKAGYLERSFKERDPTPPELRLQRSCSHPSSLLSFTSSIEEARFGSVQSMTNARLKAIKDNFKGLSPPFTIAGAANALSVYANSLNSVLGSSSSPPANSETSARSLGVDAAVGGVGSGMPSLSQANSHLLDTVQGDIVIMGGYRGSILREATGQKRRVWIPLRVGLNLRKVNLEVGLNPEDEENMAEKIVPDGMLTHIGPVDIGRRLLRRLRSGEVEASVDGQYLGRRVHEYGYDWRLSPALLSRQLITYLEKLPCNKNAIPNSPRRRGQGALVIAHSLGGLVVRHAVNQRPELFSGVIFAGTPQHCVNILGPLRNGDTVLLSSRVLTAQVNFTMRSSFVLLPEAGRCFVNKKTGEKLDIDFFDVKTWIKYALSPCVATLTPDPPPGLPGTGDNQDTQAVGGDGAAPSTPYSTSLPRVTPPSPPQPPSTAFTFPPSSTSPTPLANCGNTSLASTVVTAAKDAMRELTRDRTLAPQMDSTSHHNHYLTRPTTPTPNFPSTSTSTSIPLNPFSHILEDRVCTLSLSQTIPYLERTLLETKQFKSELHFNPELASGPVGYPPLAIIYAKNTPTVKGARVDGLGAILSENVYDDLVFGAGDGVCLAKAAQLPEGYMVAKGGRVMSDRGHISLLGDLDSVGKAVEAVVGERGW